MMENVIGIICHRAGSQRLPHKAMQLLHGRPMASYVLDAMNEVLPHIWLFTDDRALQLLSQAYSRVHLPPFPRPAELSQPDTSSEAVVRYLLQRLLEHQIALPAKGLLCQLTSPLLTPAHIRQALTYWQANLQANSMVSVCRPRKPLSWLMAPVSKQQPLLLETGNGCEGYWPNGAMYGFNVADVLKSESLLNPPVLGFDMSSDDLLTELDVDTPLEFQQVSRWMRPD